MIPNNGQKLWQHIFCLTSTATQPATHLLNVALTQRGQVTCGRQEGTCPILTYQSQVRTQSQASGNLSDLWVRRPTRSRLTHISGQGNGDKKTKSSEEEN